MLLFFRAPRAILSILCLGLLAVAAPSRAATPEAPRVSIAAATGAPISPPAFDGKGKGPTRPKPKPGPRGGDEDD